MTRMNRSVHGLVIGYLAATICGCMPTATPDPDATELEAIAVAVKAVYQQEERQSTLYLGSFEALAEDESEAELIEKVASDLQIKVLAMSSATGFPFLDPDDGSPAVGITAAVGRSTELTGGSFEIPVEFFPESGSERECQEVIVRRTAGTWQVDSLQGPSCECLPIEDYSQAVDRVREGPCCGLWSSLGTCAGWDVAVECAGFGGSWSFFDPETGLLARQFDTTDVDPFILDACGPDAFTECAEGGSEFVDNEQWICTNAGPIIAQP